MNPAKIQILADENIPQVERAFAKIGTLKTCSGRSISHKDLQSTDILLVRSVTQINKGLLEGTPVRFVASATAGFDHVDINWLKNTGITFARAPGSNALSAAEYVIAAICHWSLKNNRRLQDLRLGVVGCGQVGSRVVRLAEALGLHCIRNDPPLEEKGGKGFSTLDQALDCDIVTFHVPLETTGSFPTLDLLNKKRIDSLQAGTLLINASRGEVIEQAALKKRLLESEDIDAVLDVWHNEPKIDSELLKATLLGTPHIAGYSADAKLRGTFMIYMACCDYLGINAEWRPELPNDEIGSTNLSESEDIRRQILRAYDILGDNSRLKKILDGDTEDPALYFDLLRKNYPTRREYAGNLFDLFHEG